VSDRDTENESGAPGRPAEYQRIDPVDEKPLRLFIALELPDAWPDALREQSRALELASPGFARWVAPELMHLTLVFLGSQRPSILPRIEAAVDETASATRPLTLTPGELGSFGGARSLRVIWAGVADKPNGALEGLHARLANVLQKAGVVFETSPFRPHLTLGRAKRDQSAGSEAMHRAVRAGAVTKFLRLPDHICEEIALIRSDLRPTGPIYTALHRAQFHADLTRH
jgi:2'-5' RNA ligase